MGSILQKHKSPEELEKEREAQKTQRKHVILEVINTERAFVEDMDCVVTVSPRFRVISNI